MATIGFASAAPANGTAAHMALMVARLAAGISRVVAWSDATTPTTGVSLTSNPFGSASSGAGNLGNTNAWWIERAADGSYYWAFLRGSADTTWTCIRGKTGFSGATATSPGTDATSVTHVSNAVMWTTMGTLLMSMDDDSNDFSWWMIPTGGGNIKTEQFEESLMAGTFPSTPVADADPRVSGAYYNATGIAPGLANVAAAGGNIIAYKRILHGTGGANNARCSFGPIVDGATAGSVAPATSSGNQMQIEPYNSTECVEEITAYSPGAVAATKGRHGKMDRIRWATVFDGNFNGRFANDGTQDWVYMGGRWHKWDSSRPTI